MAAFKAFGSIATASWYKHKDFETWEHLEESLKTWCIKLTHMMPLQWQFRLFNVKKITSKNSL